MYINLTMYLTRPRIHQVYNIYANTVDETNILW